MAFNPEFTATLGQAQVSFHKLQNDGFSVSVYTRRDGVRPDAHRDCALIEDATFCIAKEFEKHARRADALSAIAEDVRSKSHIFGSAGAKLLDTHERAERQRLIESYAEKIEELAAAAREGEPTSYPKFTTIRTELTKAGFSPPDAALESQLAKAYVERKPRVRILLVRSAGAETTVTKAIESDEAHANKIVRHLELEYLGNRLPALGEPSRLQSFKGPDTVILEVARGASIAKTQEPGLYLIRGLSPSHVKSDEIDGAA